MNFTIQNQNLNLKIKILIQNQNQLQQSNKEQLPADALARGLLETNQRAIDVKRALQVHFL